MPTPAQKPATTPIPVQLSASEFSQFIFPHLSMPTRGPKCKIGYHCLFTLILWVLYTGMQWKSLPVPTDGDGKAEIHYPTVYKAFAKWSDDGSLEHAFIASVQHLADHGPAGAFKLMSCFGCARMPPLVRHDVYGGNDR